MAALVTGLLQLQAAAGNRATVEYGGPAEPLAGGRVLMAGGLLAPSTGDPPPTLAAGGAAAARLAPAVQRALAVS